MGLAYLPISWGGLGGQLIGIYMECLGVVPRVSSRREHAGDVAWGDALTPAWPKSTSLGR